MRIRRNASAVLGATLAICLWASPALAGSKIISCGKLTVGGSPAKVQILKGHLSCSLARGLMELAETATPNGYRCTLTYRPCVLTCTSPANMVRLTQR